MIKCCNCQMFMASWQFTDDEQVLRQCLCIELVHKFLNNKNVVHFVDITWSIIMHAEDITDERKLKVS